MKTLLTYDLGGSALRAALVDQLGQVIACSSASIGFSQPRPAWSEADPQEWWRTMVAVTQTLMCQPKALGTEIDAIAICGMTRTQVFVDAKAEPVRPAITWADGRATLQANQLKAFVAQETPQDALFGPINAYHTLARILWVRNKEPEVYGSTIYVLEPKDFLNFRLTGRARGDRISLSRVLSKTTGQLVERLIRRAGLDPDLFPPLADPKDRLGEVKPGLEAPFDRLAGTPVFVGGMDAWCASVGMGSHFDGCAINISGTSEVFGVLTSDFRESEGLISMPWGEGLFYIGGPSQVGADSLNWFAEVFCEDLEKSHSSAWLNDVARAKRQPRPIIFLPYLRGERAPLWEPEASGLFFGITRNHGRVDFLWAALEGVALANRQILDLATGGRPKAVSQVRIGGGAARSDLWCQVKANVLQRPLVRTEVPETGLLGAAIVGWCGLGAYASIAEAQSHMVRVARTFEPEAGPGRSRARAYDILYKQFLEIQAFSLPLFRSLGRAAADGMAFA